jgi:hypothetical protein
VRALSRVGACACMRTSRVNVHADARTSPRVCVMHPHYPHNPHNVNASAGLCVLGTRTATRTTRTDTLTRARATYFLSPVEKKEVGELAYSDDVLAAQRNRYYSCFCKFSMSRARSAVSASAHNSAVPTGSSRFMRRSGMGCWYWSTKLMMWSALDVARSSSILFLFSTNKFWVYIVHRKIIATIEVIHA